jgi:integrase
MLDVDENTLKNYRTALKKAGERFGSRDPHSFTAADVSEWVADLAASYKPGTVQLYVVALRLLLDFADVDPNPARDSRVKLPKQTREEPNPPSAEHVEAILGAMSERYRLMFVVIEQGGLRLGEAVSLRWGDVDAAASRLRLSASATKRDKARWVYLPEWLTEAIEATCPLEDRVPERRVFQGTEASAYQAMLRACRNAKVPHYSPHSLRHRGSPSGTRAGCPRGSSRNGRPCSSVNEPGRLQPRHAARRGSGGPLPGVRYVVAVWFRCGLVVLGQAARPHEP